MLLCAVQSPLIRLFFCCFFLPSCFVLLLPDSALMTMSFGFGPHLFTLLILLLFPSLLLLCLNLISFFFSSRHALFFFSCLLLFFYSSTLTPFFFLPLCFLYSSSSVLSPLCLPSFSLISDFLYPCFISPLLLFLLLLLLFSSSSLFSVTGRS